MERMGWIPRCRAASEDGLVRGIAGADYVPNDRWAFSLLWNVATAHDFAGTNTVFEGIDINSLTVAVSYYFMRNFGASSRATTIFWKKTIVPDRPSWAI
jgi:hypothetical protein